VFRQQRAADLNTQGRQSGPHHCLTGCCCCVPQGDWRVCERAAVHQPELRAGAARLPGRQLPSSAGGRSAGACWGMCVPFVWVDAAAPGPMPAWHPCASCCTATLLPVVEPAMLRHACACGDSYAATGTTVTAAALPCWRMCLCPACIDWHEATRYCHCRWLRCSMQLCGTLACPPPAIAVCCAACSYTAANGCAAAACWARAWVYFANLRLWWHACLCTS